MQSVYTTTTAMKLCSIWASSEAGTGHVMRAIVLMVVTLIILLSMAVL